MNAMRLHEPQPVDQDPLQADSVDRPDPGPGQIRLKVHVCGVCHTDLHTVEGDLELPRLPITPGHQIVATVDARGEGADRYQVGDRVGVAWLYHTCGECYYCRNGQENLCSDASFTGLHADGGYAEYMVVDEDFAYPLPDAFDDVQAAPLLCAGIVGFRALRLSDIRPGQRLGLYGFGASAHLVIQVARHWNCDVWVFTRSENHRRLAREMGARWVGGTEDDVDPRLHGSVMFAPAGGIVPHALRHLRPGGTLAINAIHTSPIPELPYHLLYEERVLRSVANFTRADAENFLRLAGEIPIEAHVEAFPLQEANDVLRRLKESEIDAAAALTISH